MRKLFHSRSSPIAQTRLAPEVNGPHKCQHDFSYNIRGPLDEYYPIAKLILAPGSLYCPTFSGGYCNNGAVFKLIP
jgi:hypothetical protein